MAYQGGPAGRAQTESAPQLPRRAQVDRGARVAVAEAERDEDEAAQRRRAVNLPPEVDEGEAEARRRESVAHPVELRRLDRGPCRPLLRHGAVGRLGAGRRAQPSSPQQRQHWTRASDD